MAHAIAAHGVGGYGVGALSRVGELWPRNALVSEPFSSVVVRPGYVGKHGRMKKAQ
jgi:hypothetical protein